MKKESNPRENWKEKYEELVYEMNSDSFYKTAKKVLSIVRDVAIVAFCIAMIRS